MSRPRSERLKAFQLFLIIQNIAGDDQEGGGTTTERRQNSKVDLPKTSQPRRFGYTLLWNELPSDLRSLSSVHSFRQKLMVYLVRRPKPQIVTSRCHQR